MEQPRSEMSPALPPDPPRNAHLYCPRCDYDLTGAPTNCCPECGRDFDPEALVRWHRERNQPLPVRGFLALATMSLFGSRRLGREMPRFPRLQEATCYGRIVRGLTVALGVCGFLACRQQLGYPPWLLVSLPVVAAIGSHLCEVSLSVAFMLLVRGRTAYGSLDYPFWRALTACFSTYLLVSYAVLLVTSTAVSEGSSNFAPISVMLIVGFWWWYSLGQAVAECSEVTVGRAIAIILIPVVGLGAVAAASPLGVLDIAALVRDMG